MTTPQKEAGAEKGQDKGTDQEELRRRLPMTALSEFLSLDLESMKEVNEAYSWHPEHPENS